MDMRKLAPGDRTGQDTKRQLASTVCQVRRVLHGSSINRGVEDADSGYALIRVMESTDMGYADHLPLARWLHRTRDRCIPLQGHVGTAGVIILEIRGHESAQVCLVKDNDPIEEFPAQGPDHPFRRAPQVRFS